MTEKTSFGEHVVLEVIGFFGAELPRRGGDKYGLLA